jgi:hypothetical protein
MIDNHTHLILQPGGRLTSRSSRVVSASSASTATVIADSGPQVGQNRCSPNTAYRTEHAAQVRTRISSSSETPGSGRG